MLGRGIARVAASAGFAVNAYDHDAGVNRRVVDDLLSQRLNVRMASSIDEAVAGADYMIEAVIEDLAIKQRVFAQAGATAPAAILMSNSSSLPIGEIALETPNPERTIGTHWFNPPELIPPVEVIPGPRTAPAIVARVTAFTKGLGKIPVQVARDVPGFVGNRLQHALAREAFAQVSDGMLDPQSVDTIVSTTVGQRLAVCGPLAEIAQLGAAVAQAELDAYLTRRVAEPSPPSAVLGEFGRGLSDAGLTSARRLRAALWREAIALVADGICDAETVDLMACRTFGLRLPHMGPIATADFVGLDLTLAVHERIFPTFDRSSVTR
jgi:3-hydroxybutyryl-CoA dehydrogenase